MPVQYGGDKITFSDGSTVGSGWSGMKNRLINGGMVVDQRNAGSSVTPTVNTYTLDRWVFNGTHNSKISVQQNAGSVTPPNGFKNYLGVTSLSAYSVAAGDVFAMTQVIEGYNIADLAWGTANAQTVTLSFLVRSSLTGTFGGVIAGGQYYPFTYTISSANTWEQKTVTITGSTTGTWNSTNSAGITIRFGLGSGSTYSQTAGSWTNSDAYSATGATSVVGTNGATFYITGVQLEKGSTATSFDYRPYGTELALCQRYYEKFDAGGVSGSYAGFGMGYSNGTNGPILFKFAVNKRANPTISQGGSIRVLSGPAVGTSWSANDNYLGTSGGYSNSTWTTSITAGYPVMVTASGDSTAFVAFSAEL